MFVYTYTFIYVYISIFVQPNAYYLKEYFYATSLNRYELENNYLIYYWNALCKTLSSPDIPII